MHPHFRKISIQISTSFRLILTLLIPLAGKLNFSKFLINLTKLLANAIVLANLQRFFNNKLKQPSTFCNMHPHLVKYRLKCLHRLILILSLIILLMFKLNLSKFLFTKLNI